ncbi:MAG: tRNA 2-thiouridine(34) synthase MnmA, partial [Ignavibacteriae bacterium]|nr:tRNA 2-thiouridine(34) synthase MnmA [Ignavibacteriota bacterium]
LLKKEGYDVTGVYMKNWSGDDFGIQADCPWEQEMEDVKKVCKVLDIPFMSFNFEKEYREKVVNYFFEEYEKGRTPNPDVMCNREIKFDMFLNKALDEGAEGIATGHYAQVIKKNYKYELHKGKDSNKDQTYFLYTLNQEQLSKTLFPIGHLEKSEVRKLAHEFNLPVADKKDSQGICFIGEIDVREFLRNAIEGKPGNIVDADTGKVIGKHDGVMYYTIGQREGLQIGGAPEPYYVVGKDAEKKEIYAAMGKNNPELMKNELDLENLHLISGEAPETIFEKKLTGAIRYRKTPEVLTIDKNLHVTFEKPQRAVAPGQSLVIYDGEICLGGGIIK